MHHFILKQLSSTSLPAAVLLSSANVSRCVTQAEVLGYVSAQRSISPDLLRPLDLHSKRPSPYHMGASCSKSSSIGIASKADSALSANPQFADSPYLVSSPGSRKSSHTAKSVHGDSSSIPAIHQDQPSGQLQAALAASAASAVLSEAAHTAATAVALAPTAAAQQPSFAQQSFREASTLYSRPLDRPSYNHKASSKKANGAKVTIDKYAPFPDALKAAADQHSWDAVEQLLQHHLFDRPDMKVRHPHASGYNLTCCMKWAATSSVLQKTAHQLRLSALVLPRPIYKSSLVPIIAMMSPHAFLAFLHKQRSAVSLAILMPYLKDKMEGRHEHLEWHSFCLREQRMFCL